MNYRGEPKSRRVGEHQWAVVLVSHDERNAWFSHFFGTEREARRFMENSKAPAHAISVRLYQLVDTREG